MTDGNTYAINKFLNDQEDYDALQEVTAELEQAEARIEELEETLSLRTKLHGEATYVVGELSDDLVKRLRSSTQFYHADCELKMACAERIEGLEAKLSKSEALLAKAVGHLEKLDRLTARDAALVQAALAELKGQDDERRRIKPVREVVELFGILDRDNPYFEKKHHAYDYTHRLTYETVDDKPDCSTVKMEELRETRNKQYNEKTRR